MRLFSVWFMAALILALTVGVALVLLFARPAQAKVPRWGVRAFLCIHRYEGSWTDRGDPYWGGLQMDRLFMRTYGAWAIRRYHGWADRWPARVQIRVAWRAHQSGRGFYPWPLTARRCGLI